MGEAATATILRDEGPRNAIYISFKTWGHKHDLCKIPLPHVAEFFNNGYGATTPMHFFTEPTELLSFTIRKLVSHVREANVLSHYEHDIVIGHTVSIAVSSAVASQLEIDDSRIFETHNRFGNTVSPSLPLALSVAEMEGRLRRGMRVLLLMGTMRKCRGIEIGRVLGETQWIGTVGTGTYPPFRTKTQDAHQHFHD